MSSEEFETRINNRLEAIIENQAQFSEDMLKMQQQQARFSEDMLKMQEAIAGLIQVARMHDEQIDRNSEQIKENGGQIKEINESLKEHRESLKEQRDHINALIRVVESHISNHP
jgi:chromosome segregation ATPase